MHQFSRTLTLNGSPRQVMPWVAKITAYVNANSGLDVSCWMFNFGRPIGTVAWSAIVESQAALSAGTADLLADDGYMDLLEEAAPMVAGPGEDRLRTLVHGTPSGPPAVGSIATVTTATAMVDRMGDALAWSVEIAQHVESVTGSPVMVLTDAFGTMGGVTWIGVAPDAAAADANAAKLQADSAYLDKLTATGPLFIPGSGQVGQLSRIA
jgi:hypothetical protein